MTASHGRITVHAGQRALCGADALVSVEGGSAWAGEGAVVTITTGRVVADSGSVVIYEGDGETEIHLLPGVMCWYRDEPPRHIPDPTVITHLKDRRSQSELGQWRATHPEDVAALAFAAGVRGVWHLS